LAVLGARFHELGFSSLGAYARERLSRSKGWARDSRVVAKRALARPRLREAFVHGRISWSMLELLLRHTGTEDSDDASRMDAELLDAVDGSTVREMRQLLRNGTEGSKCSGVGLGETDAEKLHVLQLMMPREDALALADAEALVRHVEGLGPSGTGLDDVWLEPLLAEGLTTLFDFLPPTQPVLPASVAERFARRRRVVMEGEARRDREEERAEWALDLCGASTCEGEPACSELFGRELPRDPQAIDAELRAVCHELAVADLGLAGLAHGFLRMKGWHVLGFASDTQYARERLGMSRASLRQRVALVRRMGERSGLARALVEGRVGFEAACLLSRVTACSASLATDESAVRDSVEAAWVERGEVRTYKHLREEVWAVQLLSRLEGRSVSAGPPSAEELARVWAMERDAKSGDAARLAAVDLEEEDLTPAAAVVQMSVTLPLHLARRLKLAVTTGAVSTDPAGGQAAGDLGATTARLRVSEDVAILFRQLERSYASVGLPGRFVPFLVSALFSSFGQLLGDRSRWEAIHRRDRYQCSCPVCERQDVTLHHLRYRSHGGGDEASNLLSLCSFCHLEGQHGGRLRVRGDVGQETWSLGPISTPLLVVHGRERAV